MKCWICTRQAQGYVHSDVRFRVTDAHHYPLDWVFCSKRCQQAFHALYGAWARSDPPQTDFMTREALMIDASKMEREAMRECLRPFGEAAAEIGFDRPLGHYSEQEALRVIEVIVGGYVEAMTIAHEKTRYPAVRLSERPRLDAADDPFSGIPSETPWEA